MPSAAVANFRDEKVFGAPTDFEDDMFARLTLAQDSLIEDLERKIVVSSIVGSAVLHGTVRAVSDESADLLAEKDAEINHLQRELQERNTELENQKGRHALEYQELASNYISKLKEKEMCILEQERQLSKMATNMVDLTFRLNCEYRNSATLEMKVKEMHAQDVAKGKQILSLIDEIESVKREQETEIESLRREFRIKESRCREQLQEAVAENERQLAILQQENAEQHSMIGSLAANHDEVKGELSQLIGAHRKNLQIIENLNTKLEEQKLQYEQEISILVDIYEGHLVEQQSVREAEKQETILHSVDLQSQQLQSQFETEILQTYLEAHAESLQQILQEKTANFDEKMASGIEDLETTKLLLQQKIDEAESLRADNLKLEKSVDELVENHSKDLTTEEMNWMNDLESSILIEYFIGFATDMMEAVQKIVGKKQVETGMLGHVKSGSDRCQSEILNREGFEGSGRMSPCYSAKADLEQHHQRQFEVDVLLEFFVGKIHELAAMIGSSVPVEAAETTAESGETTSGNTDAGVLSWLRRELVNLKRDRDQVVIDKTEEVFRLKRDFFKELDKLKMEGGWQQYDSSRRQFLETRQKLEDLRQETSVNSTEPNGFKSYMEEPSDWESVTSRSESGANGLEILTGSELPLLVADLQQDIAQLMIDTGMKQDDGTDGTGQKLLQCEVEELKTQLDSVRRLLEEERSQNFVLTVEQQQLEQNVSLSNGELERLHRQLEAEKKLGFNLEASVQNLKHDEALLRRQLAVALCELENGRIEWGNGLAKLKEEEIEKRNLYEENQRLQRQMCLLQSALKELEEQLMFVSEKQLLDRVSQDLEKKNSRIVKLENRLRDLKKLIEMKEADYKRKLTANLRNLRKAEEEVDALGDENDCLLNLVEEVFAALNHYSPVLQHYPKIADLSKLLKQELLSRVDPVRN